ncbi:MAG TPA: pitrilysin family protein [Acidimicrobiales bacterium]|nr:pitrilysin family protein [Acidimicrobiales bacterium]
MIESSVLPCGIRLVTETMADVRSVAVAFWVGTGSRDEPDELAGASHFLEHLLFKGTERRSAAAIAEALDEVGGDCNAFTTKEYTTFYVRLLSDHLALGLDILSDIMWTPALRPADIEAERTVILDEILMHADEPADLAAELWQSALFPGHPLGRDTLGTASSVRRITRDDIVTFLTQHYRPANMVVSAAGDCTHEAVAADLERRFAGLQGGEAPRRAAPGPDAVALDVVRRPTEQAHLVYGARSVSRFDERRWPLAVLNHVLGGGLSSRLFQKVREERGLAYSVWSERAGYEDTGSLAVVVGTAPEHLDEVLRIVERELELLATEGVTERELAVAKGNLRAEMLLSGEDSGARMSRIGASQLLHGEVLSVDEVLARIDRVDRAQVLDVAAQLAQAPRTMSAVGPFDAEGFESHLRALAAR